MLGLAALALLLCAELFVPGRSLFRWDTFIYSWPILLETRSQWLSGHFPFWASSICNGTPLLENINAGVLYPLRLLLWILPLRPGYSLFILLHVFLSLVGMRLLLRRGMGLGRWASLAGAAAYAASGYARGMWDTHNFVALPWLPLGIAALLEARRPGGGLRAAFGVATAWTLLLLSGDLQAACIWIPVAALLAVWHPARARLGAALVAGLGIAILLSAVQWLPALAASRESYRAAGLDLGESLERSFHPARLAELFLPYAFGTRDAWCGTSLMGDGAVRLTPWTSSVGLGAIALLLLPVGIRAGRRGTSTWAVAVMTGAVLLSFGRFLPGYGHWQALPIVSSFRYPEKYLLWATFAAAVLVARGFQRLAAWRRCVSHSRRAARYQRNSALLCMAAASLAACLLARGGLVPLFERMPALLITGAAAILFAVARTPRTWLLGHLAALLAIWHFEQPTTNCFDPLAPPLTLSALPRPVHLQGRVLADPAVEAVPLPPGWADWSATERQAIFYRETWLHNEPVVWGYATAAGFSPAESGPMRQVRTQMTATNDAAALADYCRLAAVEWLLTTPARLELMRAAGMRAERTAGWGGEREALVVAKIESPALATDAAGRPADVWRPRPGFIRVDLRAGAEGLVRVSESFARGWQAYDQDGAPLATQPVAGAFLGVKVARHTSQIRLSYRPTTWGPACATSAAGFVAWVGLGLWLVRVRLRRAACSAWMPAALSAFAAVLLGLAARANWSCTFDEGFHVARGVGLTALCDTRLSYFHPPLQNLLAGYFVDLAHGHRLDACAGADGWAAADVQPYSIALAAANRDIYADMIQAARWGSSLLLALLCIAGTWAAHRFGGSLAAWLAAAGLALQPSLLAHGNLATTDMGVATFTVLGTVLLAQACARGGRGIGWAVLALVPAAAVKFSGLIWLGALLIVLPLAAWRFRRPAILVWLPLAVAALAGLLLVLYGGESQAIRIEGWGAWPAGRYIEGLFRQSEHALTGHRGYLAGSVFQQGSWWHAPLTFALKVPEVWCVACVAGLVLLLRRVRHPAALAAVPPVVFALMLAFAGKLSMGIRHLLPLVALGVVAGAVAVARLRRPPVQCVAALTLVLGSVLSVWSLPRLIAQTSAWSGGLARGPAWVADSNFDWGQDAGVVESQWALLTRLNGGRPPTLYYYGFIDPSWLYRLPVGSGSYLGFMGRGRDVTASPEPGRLTVASVSATTLEPNGLPLSAVTRGNDMGELGPLYRVYRAK